MSSRRVLLLFIVGLLFAAGLQLAGCGGGSGASESDQAKAVAEARVALHRAQAAGQDLSRGPCIAESLPGLPDWVADVAHEPRRPVDDQPQNQCRRYQAGQAHHFVELTAQGGLIREQ